MKHQSLISRIRNLLASNRRVLCLVVLCLVVFSLSVSAGCATAKSVRKAVDIRDDGKSNIVVLSYDMQVFATDKYPTEKNIQIQVYCPQSSKLTASGCFDLVLPFKGRKTIDGYSLYGFESEDTQIMKMKYGVYTATHAKYSVLVDRVPDVDCYYSKQKRRDVCNRTTKDINDSHRYEFPEPLLIPVSSGTGCYLGHLSMKVIDGLVEDFTIDYSAELTPQRLDAINGDLQATVQQHVVRPCNS